MGFLDTICFRFEYTKSDEKKLLHFYLYTYTMYHENIIHFLYL
jgi:hypothetical protein